MEQLHYRLLDKFADIFWAHLTFYTERWSPLHYYYYGEEIPERESALVVFVLIRFDSLLLLIDRTFLLIIFSISFSISFSFLFFLFFVFERENHVWGCDWLTLFSLASRKGMLGACRVFAKDVVKYLPGFGWGIYLLGSVFLKRDWNRDRAAIDSTFRMLRER